VHRQPAAEVLMRGACGPGVVDEHINARAIQVVRRGLGLIGPGERAVFDIEVTEFRLGKFDPLDRVIGRQGVQLIERDFNHQAVVGPDDIADIRAEQGRSLHAIREHIHVTVEHDISRDQRIGRHGVIQDGVLWCLAESQCRLLLPGHVDRAGDGSGQTRRRCLWMIDSGEIGISAKRIQQGDARGG
jgi:hypothetical protein